MQNIIIKGRDNPVILEFTFTGDFETNGLNTFDYITLSVDSESYSTQDADNNLTISTDGMRLTLNIGDTTNLSDGYYTPTVIGYSSTYDDGYVLNSDDKRELSKITVK